MGTKNGHGLKNKNFLMETCGTWYPLLPGRFEEREGGIKKKNGANENKRNCVKINGNFF